MQVLQSSTLEFGRNVKKESLKSAFGKHGTFKMAQLFCGGNG